jgi:hypothetical protein
MSSWLLLLLCGETRTENNVIYEWRPRVPLVTSRTTLSRNLNLYKYPPWIQYPPTIQKADVNAAVLDRR